MAYLAEFFRQHRERMQAWREGDRSSPFPAGTYKMALVHGAAVEAAALPWNVGRPP